MPPSLVDRSLRSVKTQCLGTVYLVFKYAVAASGKQRPAGSTYYSDGHSTDTFNIGSGAFHAATDV